VLVLSGANTYTGVTTVSQGVLEIRNTGGLGTVGGNTVVAGGAQLAISGNALSGEPVTCGGDGPSGTGAIRSISGNNSLGAITLTGTSIQVDAGTLTTGKITGPAATLNKNGLGVLESAGYVVDTLNSNAGTAAVTSGRSTLKTSVFNNLNITVGPMSATLDLKDNDAVINNTGLTTIVSNLTTGYNNGDWSGNGITSSAAAATAFGAIKTALGVALASDSYLVGAGTFSGVAVDATDVLIRYTVAGDANLDGTVSGGDFNILASNFGTPGTKYWANADFNYDTAVTSADFNILASGFGQTVPSGSSGPGATVPEPSGILLLAFAGGLLLRRRREK
jgi:autotransporter-associated beta strand protein